MIAVRTMAVYHYSFKIHKTISHLGNAQHNMFPNEIRNAGPEPQLTDTQLQRAHEAFNMMQISAAYLKRMRTVRLGS